MNSDIDALPVAVRDALARRFFHGDHFPNGKSITWDLLTARERSEEAKFYEAPVKSASVPVAKQRQSTVVEARVARSFGAISSPCAIRDDRSTSAGP